MVGRSFYHIVSMRDIRMGFFAEIILSRLKCHVAHQRNKVLLSCNAIISCVHLVHFGKWTIKDNSVSHFISLHF